MTEENKIPVYVQEPNRVESRRQVGAWTDAAAPPYEAIEMAGWAEMESIVDVKKRKHEGAPIWLIVAIPPLPSHRPLPAQTDMRDIIALAITRGCTYQAPHKPGEDLKVWLPNGRLREYSVGDEADMTALHRELRRIGR